MINNSALDKCFFCGCEIGFNSPWYSVEQAIKPKGKPYRWKEIAKACESCGEKNKTRFEYGEKANEKHRKQV